MAASDYDHLYEAAGRKHNVDPGLLRAIAHQESRGNPKAVSPQGAIGLMQIMPATAKGLGVDPTDPTQAVDGAARLLSEALTRNQESLEDAIKEYHGGPDRGIWGPKTRRYGSEVMAAYQGAPEKSGGSGGGDFDESLFGGPDAPSGGGDVAGFDSSLFDVKPEAAKAAGAPTIMVSKDNKIVFGDTGTEVPKGQSDVIVTLTKAGRFKEGAPQGSLEMPFVQRTSQDKFEPGAYYISAPDKDGKSSLQRMPGGESESSFTAGLGQGVADIGLSLGRFLPGTEDSALRAQLEAGQMRYDAQRKGDLVSGAGRFTGQLAASAPLILGAEAALAPLAARFLAPGASQFLAGQAGGNLLTRGASLAARGAGEGAAGAALVSSASDEPLAEQLALGAAGGAVAGPVIPAVVGAGRKVGEAVKGVGGLLTQGGREWMADDVFRKFAGDQPIGGPDSSIPGVELTQAQRSGNPGLAQLETTQRIQDQTPFKLRDRANAAARLDFVENIRGDRNTVADLATAREDALRTARADAFQGAAEVDSRAIVSTIDEALASPEAQMKEVAGPLRELRAKIEQPAETTPEQAAQFNRAVAATFGGDGTALTPEVMQAARSKLGAEFERIAANTEVKWDDALRKDIGQIIHDTAQVIPESRLPPLFKSLQDIASTADDGNNISGLSYQSLTKRGGVLDKLQGSSDTDVRNAASAIRDRLDDALESTLAQQPTTMEGALRAIGSRTDAPPPNALEELRNVRLQYKNLKTVEKALSSAGVDKQVTPEAVLRAVKGNFKDNAYTGGGPLGDVAEAAVRAEQSRPPRVETNAEQIAGMRENVQASIDSLRAKGTDPANLAADRLEAVVARMDEGISGAAPGYAGFREQVRTTAEPVEAMRYLQNLRLTDANGKVTLGAVNSAVETIEKARAKAGNSAAKSISPETMEQLYALRDDLRRAENVYKDAPRGSPTAPHLVTSKIAGDMGAPMAIAGALGAPTHPLALFLGKTFLKGKEAQLQDAITSRLLGAESPTVVSRPAPSRVLNSVKFLGQPLLPVASSMATNRLLGGQ